MVESVYSAVRTDSLRKADYVSSLKGYAYINRRQHLLCTSLQKVVKKSGRKAQKRALWISMRSLWYYLPTYLPTTVTNAGTKSAFIVMKFR
jgi:hypothetical protein